MQRIAGITVYSASDICNFSLCEHLATLDRRHLDTPLSIAEDDEHARLIQQKGMDHERRYLAHLQAQGLDVVDVSAGASTLDGKVNATIEAMSRGADVIYQAALRGGIFAGYVDFLRRTNAASPRGGHLYEVVDTKLALSAKATAVVQVCVYSELLTRVQGHAPESICLVLGDGREERMRYADYDHYVRGLMDRFERHVAAGSRDTSPEPCAKCAQCRWRDLCDEQWRDEDHLGQVANITRLQSRKLREAGVTTMAALADLAPAIAVPKIGGETLARLRHQAQLQVRARQTGQRHYAVLPVSPKRGFERLPRPDAGDIFFDMEGDPFEPGGLEYLFGAGFIEAGNFVFRPFWAHERAEERAAFESFMDFACERLARFPDAHVYHYAAYEESALKRLSSAYGTRGAQVDDLLRRGKLVDLYKVVREGLRVSEPAYSIKNIEHYYMEARTGDVKTAGASIVWFEKWKESRDPELLRVIAEYNEDDVRSTLLLREWLLTLRPDGVAWFVRDDDKGVPSPRAVEADQALAQYEARLMAGVDEDEASRTPDQRLRALTFHLLDFHRRAQKPLWWAMFARQEMTADELVDDVECLGGLVLDPEQPPVPSKQSLIYTYRYPPQETKLATGQKCTRTDTLASLAGLTVDPVARRVTVKCGKKNGPLPERLGIGPAGPPDDDVLRDAVRRFADSLLSRASRYPAVDAILNRDLPSITGRARGAALIGRDRPLLEQVKETIGSLDHSAVFVQGPPGAGKTYAGSRVIVDLLRRGFRVGVSSNSHKAINNLLAAVESAAAEEQFTFVGAKKSGDEDQRFGGRLVADHDDNAAVLSGRNQLVAGTAWLFARPAADQQFDYLFVDEAGQIALANLVAMGTSARNIVLLGDQMQLAQPVQGIHPGQSGLSVLEFMLEGRATIPPDRGIFLDTTWRMHPAICGFISEAVYDGRLEPEPANARQRLVLRPGADPRLKPAGLVYIPAEHDGCSQSSPVEAAIVRALYDELLAQDVVLRDGMQRRMTPDDILVVAPYNMQVNLLRSTLPGARVGTVDKFQGQEAQVVLVSMATSSGENLPRMLEFLFSKNRLNVAISRARCLSVVIASPELMSVHCTTPEQMALVNTLCWFAASARSSDQSPMSSSR